MPVYPAPTNTIPDVWSFFSHSYGDGNAGSFDQTGRMDAVFRQRMDVEYSNWNKYAVAGSRLLVEGASAGGWATLWRETSGGKFPGKTAPYTGQGGALVMVFGINDLGTLGGATTQIRTAYQHTLRACISRWRASTIWETTASNTAFTGAWTTETTKPDQASSSEWRYSSTTTPLVTLTLPSDYAGEPIALCFTGRPGTPQGGTVTFSGTAGVTGTLSTDNIMPSATLTNCPVIKRITNLTSSNAGQTIIATVTSIQGLLYYDCAWIESKTPPPVIVADVPRLTSTGYSTKYPSWTQQTGSLDSDVTTLNADMASVIAEFDGMVQMAYLDRAMSPGGSPDATLFSDGLHPNDRGAALCADALYDAVQRLVPNRLFGLAAQFNTPARKANPIRRPAVSQNWYCGDFTSVGTAAAPVSGDMYAAPFYITEGNTAWDLWGIECSVAGSTTSSVRFGMYNDLNYTGYPDTLLQEITVSGALSCSNSTGLKSSNGGGFIWRPDPGLYWLAIKWTGVGTSQTFATINGPTLGMPQLANTGLVSTATGRACAWKLTGQGAGVFPSTFPSAAALTNVSPYFGMRRI